MIIRLARRIGGFTKIRIESLHYSDWSVHAWSDRSDKNQMLYLETFLAGV